LQNEFVHILNQLSYIKMRITHLSSGHSITTSTTRDGYTHRVSHYTGLLNDSSPDTSSHERTWCECII